MSHPGNATVVATPDRPAGDPPPPAPVRMPRRLVAEAVGTGLLMTAIVGSGTAASRLSPDDAGLQLAYHAAVVAAVLGVLIVVFAPISGAHFNPAVTLVSWLGAPGRRGAAPAAGAYLAAQLAGAAGGAVLANVMFDLPAVALAGATRTGTGQWLGEALATAGLVLVIGALGRGGRPAAIPVAVGAWIGAAIWFTASTSFANPAVTLARMLTDGTTGISPGSVPAFVAAQLAGATLGAGLISVLWPARERR